MWSAIRKYHAKTFSERRVWLAASGNGPPLVPRNSLSFQFFTAIFNEVIGNVNKYKKPKHLHNVDVVL